LLSLPSQAQPGLILDAPQHQLLPGLQLIVQLCHALFEVCLKSSEIVGEQEN
jgi:hypothetical protein